MSTHDAKRFGTRDKPREMLTPEAAVALSKDNGRAVWIRLPMYDGKFHIWPGGRKEFWPDRAAQSRGEGRVAMSKQLGTCNGFCECYKVPHRKELCNAPNNWHSVPAPAEAAKEGPMDWKKIAQELYANLAVVLDQIDSCGPTEMIGAAFDGRELKTSREILAKYRKEIYGNG